MAWLNIALVTAFVLMSLTAFGATFFSGPVKE